MKASRSSRAVATSTDFAQAILSDSDDRMTPSHPPRAQAIWSRMDGGDSSSGPCRGTSDDRSHDDRSQHQGELQGPFLAFPRVLTAYPAPCVMARRCKLSFPVNGDWEGRQEQRAKRMAAVTRLVMRCWAASSSSRVVWNGRAYASWHTRTGAERTRYRGLTTR